MNTFQTGDDREGSSFPYAIRAKSNECMSYHEKYEFKLTARACLWSYP